MGEIREHLWLVPTLENGYAQGKIRVNGVRDGERGTQVAPLRFIFVRFIFVRVILFLSDTRGEGRIHDISEVCLDKLFRILVPSLNFSQNFTGKSVAQQLKSWE